MTTVNQKNISILILEDEKNYRYLLAREFEEEGFHVEQEWNIQNALKKAETSEFDIILLDLNISGEESLEYLESFQANCPGSEIIFLTGYGTVEKAVNAVKKGAYDFIEKPCPFSSLKRVILKAYQKKCLSEDKENLALIHNQKLYDYKIIGKSKAIQNVMDLIQQVSKTDVPVLIVGESGTGKELVAREIHRQSLRASHPFVDINCSNFPANLFESLLFGHKKGAFTGATENQKGLVEAAKGGSLFLDEIGELEMSLQPKVLRFLETGEFRRVGEIRTLKSDTRILAATNRNLQEEIREKRFREDLYYRLNVFTIHLPPLRERKEDIPLLIQYFLGTHRNKKWKYSQEMVKAFMEYPWPGNIRELKNTIERLKILSKNQTISDESWKAMLFMNLDYGKEKESLGRDNFNDSGHLLSLQDLEKQHILKALKHFQGNKSQAAAALGISTRSLYNKLKQYEIEEKDDQEV
ncbi:MAG: sigma-54-dependent Fis family transcriptional regulator [Planctomycetota bacterium]|nr:MAG: sigma-54-dependent Fis family transcriptional regulator [Planctomycetota bacterium]